MPVDRFLLSQEITDLQERLLAWLVDAAFGLVPAFPAA